MDIRKYPVTHRGSPQVDRVEQEFSTFPKGSITAVLLHSVIVKDNFFIRMSIED